MSKKGIERAMYRPCLHCGVRYDENECAQICTYGEERKRLRELEKEQNEYPVKTLVGNNSVICSKSSEDYDKLIADIGHEAITDFVGELIANW